MSEINWHIKGVEFAACNCDWGCPCQFNSLPTHGNCEAIVGMRIEDGEFDGTRLDGVTWVGTFAWPGPIHEGNGEAQVFIDESASDEQQAALLKILSGEETDPGATIFQVFSTTFAKMHDPQRVQIEFSADVEQRTGRVVIPGLIESVGSPILNPVTGRPHRVRVQIPEGFEYDSAEYGCSSFSSTGSVPMSSENSHAHFTELHMNRHGVVR